MDVDDTQPEAAAAPQPSRCPLCGVPVAAGEPRIETPGFLTKRDPLWRYCGLALHRGCFAGWSERAGFVRKFNIVMENFAQMGEDGTIEWLDPAE